MQSVSRSVIADRKRAKSGDEKIPLIVLGCTLVIGHVRCIKILTWLGGFFKVSFVPQFPKET